MPLSIAPYKNARNHNRLFCQGNGDGWQWNNNRHYQASPFNFYQAIKPTEKLSMYLVSVNKTMRTKYYPL